jgi:hypothetical protein
MKAYQLFPAVSKALQQEIVAHLHDNHLQAFRMVVAQLAVQRKLRPIFMEKKSAAEQMDFVIRQLSIKPNDDATGQVIQLWLLKGQQAMLKTFLDAVGIENKDGEVENLPDEISEATAKKGIDALLETYAGDRAALYLHMFQMQKPGGWEGLAKAMDAEPKLKLG